MRFWIFWAFAIALPADAHAQNSGVRRLTVAVAVEDDSIGGIISSAMRAAVRSLGDVDIVGAKESPDFVIEGIILCDGSCSRTPSVAASIQVWSVLTFDDLQHKLQWAGIVASDSATRILQQTLTSYRHERSSWVARWGRDRWEPAARQLVARIDSGCFEQLRTSLRILAMPLGEARNSAAKAFVEKQWNCDGF
jgi:hypothetical protein